MNSRNVLILINWSIGYYGFSGKIRLFKGMAPNGEEFAEKL